MRFKKLTLLACSVAALAAFAAEEPKKADAKAEAAPAAVAPAAPDMKAINAEVDKLLAWIPEVIATCGEKKIMGAQLRNMLKPNLMMAVAQGEKIPENELKMFSRYMAEQLVVNELICDAAVKEGIKLDENAIKEKIAEAKKQMGEDVFNKQLKASNLTEEDLFKHMAQAQLTQKFIDPKVQIPEEDIKKFYEGNKAQFTNLSASHILAIFPGAEEQKAPTEADKAKAKEKIQKVQKELAEGKKSFADLAKEYSDCPSKEQGGDLGVFHPGQMVPEFEKALDGMKAGDVSGIVETQFGYHIIKAGEKKVMTLDEVKDNIKQRLFQEKASQVYLTTGKKLLDEAKPVFFIEVPQPPAAPAAPAAK